MRIELIKTQEPNSGWYKIYIDGKIQKCFGFEHIPEETARKAAEDYFDRCVKYRGSEVEIIKSVEV